MSSQENAVCESSASLVMMTASASWLASNERCWKLLVCIHICQMVGGLEVLWLNGDKMHDMTLPFLKVVLSSS